MKKNVFGFLGLLGALLLASCTNPMIASGSSDEPEAPTPVVAVVAHPDTYCVGESALLSATVTNSGNGSVAYQWYKVTGTGDEAESLAIEGAVSSTYISKELSAGDYVYFVKVSNTLGKSIKIVDSDPKKITVKPEALAEASIPSITLTKNKEFYAKGGRVTLVATARTSDDGVLTYQWFNDDHKIEGATASTYTWEEASAGEYTFKVEVTNTLNGTSKTADASIEVLVLEEEKVDAERPVFTSSLVSKTYNIGDDVASVQELDGSATVSDGGKLIYQWYIVTSAGDEKINGAGSAKYKPSIEKEGDVEYKVVVTNYNLNASGETAVSASMNVIISVVDPSKENASVPVITSQPESAEYTIGDSGVTPLSVIANGDGNLSYQWYKNDAAISEANESTYTPDISEVAENTYYVVVTNSITDNGDGGVKSISVTSEKVTVTVKDFVLPAPVFTTQPVTSISCLVGDTTTDLAFIVLAKSDYVAANNIAYQWFKIVNGEKIALEGKTSRTLDLMDADLTDAAGTYKYVCKASISKEINGKPYTAEAFSNECSVIVTEEVNKEPVTPVITAQPVSEAVSLGSPATALSVTASKTDEGTLSYQWYLNDAAIGGATSSTYAVGTPAAAGEYKYFVRVTNTLNGKTKSVDSSVAVITVTDTTKINAVKPVFTTDLTEETVTYIMGDTPNKTLSVAASVSDEGTLTYEWYKGTEKIDGATSASYTPLVDAVGTFKYTVHVINTIEDNGDGGVKTATAISKEVTVVINDLVVKEPRVQVGVDKVSYVEGDTVVCTADVSNVDADAVLSYEWYVDEVKRSTTDENTYEIEVSEAGDYDVYCNVIATRKNGIYVKTNYHVSDDATFTVSALVAATPTVSTSTSPVSYEKNAPASAMTVTASVTDGGALSYQWYKASDATEAGEAINTATSSSYTPDTSKAGTTYYYAKVTNTKTNGSKNVTAVRDSGRIVVNVTSEETYAATPVISAQPQSKDYYQGDTATALSVTASVTSEGKAIGGNLSYQWYKATSADGEESAISDATNETYTPEIAAIGSSWYYCIVTNTAEAADINKTATKKSSYAKISVTEFVAKKPSVSISPATVSVKSGDSVTLTASVSGQDEGAVLTYQWKKNGVAIDGATSATYTFTAPAVTEETNFTYTCEVTSTVTKYNATATATGDKTVNVTVAPATGSISIDFN